jgi:hypothetical protein
MTPSRAEASRINGAKSHGPKTEDGRRAVSLNAVKHGLTAETVVLPNESEEEYQAELHGYLQHFAPANKAETDLVLQLASAQWRLARYTAVETSLFDIQMEKSRKHIDKEWKNVDESVRLALAFESLSGTRSPLALLNRYQARLHHEYQRILKTLLQMQTARLAAGTKLPNEPEQPAPDRLNLPETAQPETRNAETRNPNSVSSYAKRSWPSSFATSLSASVSLPKVPSSLPPPHYCSPSESVPTP